MSTAKSLVVNGLENDNLVLNPAAMKVEFELQTGIFSRPSVGVVEAS